MKKGTLTLENLIMIAVTAMILIALLVVLFRLISSFSSKPKAIHEQDFDRMIKELDDLIKQSPQYAQQGITIDVPVVNENGLLVSIIPKQNAPIDLCQGKACICFSSKGVERQKCQVYDEVSSICTQNCGDICFTLKPGTEIPKGRKTVKLTRNCNEITIS